VELGDGIVLMLPASPHESEVELIKAARPLLDVLAQPSYGRGQIMTIIDSRSCSTSQVASAPGRPSGATRQCTGLEVRVAVIGPVARTVLAQSFHVRELPFP
jgi:hypothetical protein